MIEQPIEKTFTRKSAGFWIRFFAYSVDVLLIWAVCKLLIVGSVFRLFGIDQAMIWMFSAKAVASAVLFYVYFVLMTKWCGQTLGKMIFGLRVVSDKQQHLTWTTVLIREWIGRYISVTIKLLYLVVAFTPKHQAIHDLLADTRVVYENSYEMAKIHQKTNQPEVKQLQQQGEV